MADQSIPPFPDIPGVRFAHIPDFLGYAASDDGHIWSCRRHQWHILKAHPHGLYLGICLWKNNKQHNRYVHRLVLEVFVGMPRKKLDACHNDSNIYNNTLRNLRWDTRKNNQADKKTRNELIIRPSIQDLLPLLNSPIPPLPTFPNINMREITGWPGYAVTDTGSMLSCRITGPQWKFGSWHFLKPLLSRRGQRYIVLWNTGKTKRTAISRLVLEAFIGLPEKGQHACHNNGDPTNDTLDNLRWDTATGNEADKKKHGTHIYGEKHHQKKLSESDVRTIRELCQQGVPQRHVAKRFGISQHGVSLIHRRLNWKYLL